MAAALALLATLAPAVLAQGYMRVDQTLSASTTVGKASGHARAIACTNGGWLTKLRTWTDRDRVAGIELCCSGEESRIWFEGGVADQPCLWFGMENERADGARPTCPCAYSSAAPVRSAAQRALLCRVAVRLGHGHLRDCVFADRGPRGPCGRAVGAVLQHGGLRRGGPLARLPQRGHGGVGARF